MSALKSTTSIAPGNHPPAAPRRLTMQQTAAAIGTNLGYADPDPRQGCQVVRPVFPADRRREF